MISTVIFITESPFSERDYSRFGVEILRRNFDVKIFDCTSLLKPYFWEKHKEVRFQCSGYHAIGDIEQFLSLIAKIKYNSVAIDFIGIEPETRRIRMILQKFGIPRVILHSGLLPNPVTDFRGRVLRILFLLKNPKLLSRGIGRRIERLLMPSTFPQIALCSGKAGLNDPRLVGVKHKIFGHSFDYDLYLANKHQLDLKPSPYAVFLDEDMIYHSDYDHASLKPAATEGSYYGSMNKFFDAFELETGIPIRVAAHPRSRYDLRPELWGKRSVIYGKTAQLVQDATIVLCHQSTSVSFAVLWRKPLIYLTTNEINSSFLGPRVSLFSRLLRAPLFNVDYLNVIPPIELLTVINEPAYAEYIEQYIKLPNTPDIPLWDIFSQYIKREF